MGVGCVDEVLPSIGHHLPHSQRGFKLECYCLNGLNALKERLDFAGGKLGSGVAQASAVMDRNVGCEMNPLTLGDDPCEIFTVLVNGQGFIPRSSFNKEISASSVTM